MRNYRSSNQVLRTVGESGFPDSLTIPDQAPSMRELLVRHANGITDNVSQRISYSGDMPDLRNVEPHELKHMVFEAQQTVKQLDEYRNELAIKMQEAKHQAKRENDLRLLKMLKEKENGTV